MLCDLTVEDPVLTEFSDLLGEQVGKTRDALCRDVLAASASAIDVSGSITTSSLDSAVQTLLNNDAKMVTQMIQAGTGEGTTPVGQAFWAMAHTEKLSDIRGLSGFVPVREYPRQDDVQDAEWGAYENVRFLLSTQGYKDTDLAHPYKIPIVGQNAYGVTEIEGGAAKNIVKPFGSGGTEDPLEQRATSGWKLTYTARILNDNFMIKLDNLD